jgi:hypothetical protein
MKLRLLLQEKEEKSRKSEHEKERTSREGIAKGVQEGQDRRTAERLKQWQAAKALNDKNFIMPPGAFPADAETAKSLGIGVKVPVNVEETHQLQIIGPHKIYVPKGTMATPYRTPIAPPATSVDDGY